MGHFTDPNDRFPYPFMYFYELNPYHSIYLKPEKEKIEREASKLNAGEKEPEREKENKGDSFFVGGTT